MRPPQGSSSGGSGTLRGWGTVDLRGTLENNGRIVADALGIDGEERALDLGSFASVTHDDSLGIEQSDGTQAGWYAVNRGILRLPAIPLVPGANSFNWGEDPDDESLDLVNSVHATLTGVSGHGNLAVDLLAPDHTQVPDPDGRVLIGVWSFQLPSGITAASADLLFRYDDRLAEELRIWEDDLHVYQFAEGAWHGVTSDIDTDDNFIYANGVNSLSIFAVGSLIGKLTTLSNGHWLDPSIWDMVEVSPSKGVRAVVAGHRVVVDTDGDAFSLLIEGTAGSVEVVPSATLSVVDSVKLQAGTLAIGGTVRSRSLEMDGGKLQIGPAGTMETGLATFRAGSEYLCQLDASGNGRLDADVAVFYPDTTLNLQAVGNLGDLDQRDWGDKTRTILTAERGIKGTFAQTPAVGDHLGRGAFFQGITYGRNAIDVHAFQAAPGDTDGNRLVDAADVSRMLPLYGQGPDPDAGWQTGDFNASGAVDFDDGWSMLGLFGQGPYMEWQPGEPAEGQVTVYYHPPTGNIRIDTGSLEDLRGIKLESASGIFTGEEPDWHENSLFHEFTRWQVGSAALEPFSSGPLSGIIDWGPIARPGLDSDFLRRDLVALYTTAAGANLHAQVTVVPEPASVVLLGGGLLVMLGWSFEAARRRRQARRCSHAVP